jgi:hypothetical protein
MRRQRGSFLFLAQATTADERYQAGGRSELTGIDNEIDNLFLSKTLGGKAGKDMLIANSAKLSFFCYPATQK